MLDSNELRHQVVHLTFCWLSADIEDAARLLLHSGAALLQAAALRTDRDAPLRRDMTSKVSQLNESYRKPDRTYL